MRREIKATAAAAGVLFLGGCGKAADHTTSPPPTLERRLATDLATRSDAVADALAAGDSCQAAALAGELQRKTIDAINRGQVAPLLQEPLSTSVNDLVARVQCVPPPEHSHGHDKHKKKKEGD
jgi:hypothetical protein